MDGGVGHRARSNGDQVSIAAADPTVESTTSKSQCRYQHWHPQHQ